MTRKKKKKNKSGGGKRERETKGAGNKACPSAVQEPEVTPSSLPSTSSRPGEGAPAGGEVGPRGGVPEAVGPPEAHGPGALPQPWDAHAAAAQAVRGTACVLDHEHGLERGEGR